MALKWCGIMGVVFIKLQATTADEKLSDVTQAKMFEKRYHF